MRRRVGSSTSFPARRVGPSALAAAVLALLALSPAASALDIGHDSYVAGELPGASDGDGIIGPGDTFTLTENVLSAEFTPLTHVTGTLSTTATGVTVGQASSAYPDLTFGASIGNITPFQATLASTSECGVSVPMTVMLNTDQGAQPVSFSVATGSAGTPVSYPGTGVPASIVSPGYTTSSFTVATAGRVHGVTVALSNLSQSYDGDLRIDLVAPDGTDVELYAPNPAKGGQNFTNTVFDDAAASSIMAANPPYTGTFKPAQPLAAFDGVQQQGTWQLVIYNSRFGDAGTLTSWSASVAPAVCAPPAPVDPDGDGEGHGDGDGHGRGHAKHSTSHHRGAE